MNKETGSVKKFTYKAQMRELLGIIAHSLYTHPEVFLRELISNACDALNKARFRELTDKDILDAGKELYIKIEIDSKKQTFSIEDNGIGMTESELVNNIGTVARSGTLEFLKKAKEEGKTLDENLIGQFGVGFYSVFMVTEDVTIETLSALSNSKAYRWNSQGEGEFSIEEIDRKKRGTKISFKLKESAKEFCEDWKVKQIINKYSNFADFPIFLANEKVNKVSALWHRSKTDITENELNEFYKFITNDSEEPLGHLHLAIEGGVNFKALIFVPKTAPIDLLRFREEKSLHLYSNKILIQDDCRGLLPEYLRFVKGVADTTDLPLNVSREVTQESPAMSRIRKSLTSKILSLLDDWTKNSKEKYEKFYKNFGPLLKTGVNTDFENRDKIIELLRFESSLKEKGELMSLKDYVSGIKKEQKEIYYLSGESRSALERNPNLEYFKKNEIEVLLLSEPVDVFIVPSIGEYDKKPIKSIDKADIELIPKDKIEKVGDNLSKSLISLFKEVLGEKVEDVVESKRLVSSAVTLVVPKEALDTQVEKMMKMMNKDSVKSKRIMEVNLEHPLVRNLSKVYMADNKSPILEKCILQLYEGVSLIDGNLASRTDFVKRMTEIMQEATK